MELLESYGAPVLEPESGDWLVGFHCSRQVKGSSIDQP